MAKATNRSQFTVHLRHNGVLHTFYPDDTLPDWAVEKISNPYVHGRAKPDPHAASLVRVPRAVRAAPAPRRAQPADEVPEGDEDDVSEGPAGRPPENGVGAGRDVWAEYATTHGVEVESAWRREEIIAACKAAGV
jgi:hypothetical protein